MILAEAGMCDSLISSALRIANVSSAAGKDATEAFEDVGHSDEARDLLKGMLVGEFEKNSASCFSF